MVVTIKILVQKFHCYIHAKSATNHAKNHLFLLEVTTIIKSASNAQSANPKSNHQTVFLLKTKSFAASALLRRKDSKDALFATNSLKTIKMLSTSKNTINQFTSLASDASTAAHNSNQINIPSLTHSRSVPIVNQQHQRENANDAAFQFLVVMCLIVALTSTSTASHANRAMLF